jgi:hypothetical protein
LQQSVAAVAAHRVHAVVGLREEEVREYQVRVDEQRALQHSSSLRKAPGQPRVLPKTKKNGSVYSSVVADGYTSIVAHVYVWQHAVYIAAR